MRPQALIGRKNGAKGAKGPRYRQIADGLLKDIASGKLAVGNLRPGGAAEDRQVSGNVNDQVDHECEAGDADQDFGADRAAENPQA